MNRNGESNFCRADGCTKELKSPGRHCPGHQYGLPEQRPDLDITWMERAMCRQHHDPDLWFTQPLHREAVKICRGCPVRMDCIGYVLSWEKPSYRHGVYGGLTTVDRKKIGRGDYL